MTTSPRAHRSAVDPRAKFIFGKPEEDGDILGAVKHVKPDAIMHFAASALVGESMTNPKKYFHNNFVNALKLADAAVECGVKKFVFSSTCATYGPPDKIPMTEDLPQRPINPYGEAKLMFEKALIWYQQIYKLEFIAFRYFNAAGASEKFGEHHRIETHIIPNVLLVALGKKVQCEIYARIIRRPTARASAITSTSGIWRRRTCSACSRARPDFTTSATGDGYSVRQVIQMVREGDGQKNSGD